MSELDHCREQSSTRFVSLDTHPANNSLVVTYETLVLVRDPANGRELCRRSKRDQFQIRIAALDHLNNENSSAAIGGDGDDSSTSGGGGDRLREVKLNLRKLSEEILAKCPILSEANRAETLEDIQLNLFYLINRKQAQLTNPTASQRPPSSASMRLRSNTSTLLSTGSARLMSARQGSAANTIAAGPRASRDPSSQTHRSTDGGGGSDNPLEVYLCFCERELRLAKRRDYLDYERLDVFVKQFDEHLSELESELKLDRLPRMGCQLEDLEAQLENLYGEMDERRCSIAIIRRIVRNDSDELISVGSNRLLVCALLRILRDSEGPSTSRDCSAMSESILYCLIRFTSFEDVFNATAFGEVAITGDNESLDLVRVILDILDGHIKWLTVNCDNDFRLLTSNSYYTNALLIVLANILRLDSTGGGGGDASHRIKQRIIQQHGAKLVDILSGLLNLSVKHLARDIRTTSNKSQERLTVTLLETLSIFRQFTIFKAFVNLIRPAARIQPLVDSLVALLNTLQLSRPGSGSNNQLQQVLAGDRATLSKIYELEIELMSVIGNLIYDLRFRTRFTRNNLLLKCILRSLVVLLAANRRSDTLHPFNNSQVLIVPLRCLYELSCSDKIKHELFESRVIVKCLLEYLLSSTNNLRGELDVHLSATGNPDQMEPLPGETDNLEAVSSSSTSSTARLRRVLIGDKLDLNENDQIVLSTRDASQYIVSLWINLSSKPEAPIYKQTDEDILRLLQDYIQLALTNFEQFTKLLARVVLASNPMTTTTTILIDEHLLRSLRHLHLMNYVHMKLIRNMTQFLAPTSQIPLEKLIQSIDELLNCSQQQVQFQATFVPLLVECLASLTNVIDRSISNDQQRIGLHSQKLASILSSLFGDNGRPLIDGAPPSTMDMENDDLLLIAINYLGCLARVSEICPYLESIQDNLIRTIQLVLQLRSADLEMVICCLFTLDQLMNHSQFIRELGSSLDEMTGEQHSGEPNQLLAHQLIEQLSLLIMHPNSLVVGFADQILNKLKQFEESQSLADSVTGQKRFAIYNSKWLNAIRANREDPPTDGAADLTEAEQEVSFAIRARQNGNGGGGSITTIDDEEETDLEEYRQLRTINADDTSRTWSRLTSTSSVSRSSSRFVVGTKSDRRHNQQQGTDDGGEFEGDEMIDNEDEEEEEDTSSEPDVNVIDSLSMIGHLTSGRELRGAGSELSRR